MMRRKLILMLLAGLLCCFQNLKAQTGGEITGKVVDAMGELPGVSVVVKGTTNGISTDLNGVFKLSGVKPDDVLQFSFIGYKTQEIKVGNQKTFNVTMEEDSETLDEVVVVGYQEVRKKRPDGFCRQGQHERHSVHSSRYIRPGAGRTYRRCQRKLR